MKAKKIASLILAAFAFTACQQNGYKIVGSVEGINDGDTVFLSKDLETGIPCDTVVIKNGKFEITGQADSVLLGIVFLKNNPSCNVMAFLEQGTINITLNSDNLKNTVSGTKANDGLQEMNLMTIELSKQINELISTINDANVTEETKNEAIAKIEELKEQADKKSYDITLKNIDNELGFFLVQRFFNDPAADVEKCTELFNALPEKYRNRSAMNGIKERLDKMSSLAEGKTIADFTLTTPEGTDMNIMSEVEKHELTIIDFWASWCGPCRREMPTMVELYNNYSEKGLGIVGVSLDENKDEWVKAIGDLGLKWPQMSDLKGWKSAAAEQFMVNAIPFMIIVDKNGTIVAKGLRGEKLEAFVSNKLNNK